MAVATTPTCSTHYRRGMTQAPVAPQKSAAPVVDVARTLAQVEALGDLWRQLRPGNVDAAPDFFAALVEHLPGVVRPHVVHICLPPGRHLLAVARLEDVRLPLRLGYLRGRSPRLRCVVVAFDGLLGTTGPDDVQLLLDALRSTLDDGTADAVLLPAVDVHGPLWPLVVAAHPRRRQFRMPAVVHWRAELGGSADEFLATLSKGTRKQLRYYERRLERTYGSDLRLERMSGAVDLARLLDAVSTVSAKTYQGDLAERPGGPVQQGLLASHASSGRLRGWVLFLQDAPIAFWYGVAHAGTFSVDCPGYDPAYGKDNVGTCTMVQMIRDLADDEELHRLDFGQGDAEYKRTFGGHSTTESTVLLFAPTPRALLVKLVQQVCVHGGRLSQDLLRRAGRREHLRAAWRSRLAQRR